VSGIVGQINAFVLKEAGVAASRTGFLKLKFGLSILLCSTMAAVWIQEVGLTFTVDAPQMAKFGELLAQTLGLMAYVTAIFASLAVSAGALEDAWRSGMLEILLTSPLSEEQIFISIIGGRLLVALQMLITAAPLLAVPIAIGSSMARIVLRAAIPIVLGALLSTSFAVSLAASELGPARRWAKLLVFILLTPFLGPPAILSSLLLAIAVVLPLLAVFPSVMFGLIIPLTASFFFPFVGLGVALLQQPSSYMTWVLGGATGAVFSTVVCARRSREAFLDWVDRVGPSAHKEGPKPREEEDEGPRPSRDAIRRMWRAEEAQDIFVQASSARVALDDLDGFSKVLYALSGHNPFVFREVLAPPGKSGWLLGLGIVAVGLIGALSGVDAGTAAGGAGILVCAYFACEEGSRLIPGGSGRTDLDFLLVTPLRGRDLIIGGAAAAARRAAPAVVASGFLVLLPLSDNYRIPAAVASLCLFASLVLLAYGIALWSAVAIRRPGERIAVSFMAFLILVVGTGMMSSWSGGVGDWHPLRAWLASDAVEPAVLLGAAALVGGPGLALTVSFAAGFRKILTK
jgi:hypothetical protein